MLRKTAALVVPVFALGGMWLAIPAGAAGTDPAQDLPKAGCSTLADPKGDATFENEGQGPNDPDLDITALTLRTTDTELVAYINVDKLAAGPSNSDGHRFGLKFTFNKHAFALSASSYTNGSGQIRDGLATSGQAAHVVQLTVDPPSPAGADPGFKASGAKATWDLKNSRLVLELPLSDIAKYDGGVPFTGDLTVLDANTSNDWWARSTPSDTTIKGNGSTSTDKWTIGNNLCFGPAPAVLANTGVTTAQYGDSAAVKATLKSASGAAVSGAKVSFALGDKTVTATTDAAGVALGSLPITATAGSSTLTLTYAGDAANGAATVQVPFTVAEEKSVLTLKPTKAGAKRTVGITLLDDDGTAIAAQSVTVTADGKTTTLTTNAAGKVNYVGAKPGQTVKVAFAEVVGKYTATSAQAKV